MTRVVPLALGGLALLGVACGSLERLGPTPTDEGIVFYIHADFVGSSQQLNTDVRNLEEVEGPCVVADENGASATWNDCLSSIRVLPGWQATLYRDRDFKGATLTVTEDMRDLKLQSGPCDGSFNDCVSSVRVARR